MNQQTPALRVDSVCKSFAGTRVVDRVSFEAWPGEVVALVGPNGAGKTTLLRMIVDIIRPDEGTVELFGRKAGPEIQDRVGYLPEERGLYQRDTVGRTLKYVARLKGLSADDVRGLIRTHLRRIGLASEWDQKVQKLSKGQQQKVQFAATIIADPDLVLLDEPFSGLDPLNRCMVAAVVRDLAAAGKTVVLSTHEMHQVESLCDRVLMIHQGRIALSGSLAEVRSRYADDAYVIETSADLARLPGVASVQGDRGRSRVRLAPGVAPSRFLAEILAGGAEILHFERALPSIEDIFVRVIREAE